MNPEDLQAQVTRSAAVERELREQVAGLKAQVAKLNEDVDAATSRATAAEETVKSIATMLGWDNVPPREALERNLNGLRGRLETAESMRDEAQRRWTQLVADMKANSIEGWAAAARRAEEAMQEALSHLPPVARGDWVTLPKAEYEAARAALAGEQRVREARCENGHYAGGWPPSTLTCKQCGGSFLPPARAGEPDPFRTAALAACAYLAAQAALAAAGTSPERPDAARRLAEAWIALTRACGAVGTSLDPELEKLTRAARACNAGDFDAASRIVGLPIPQRDASGIPLIDHDFQANTWPKRDECDKRVSDNPDGRPSRQCGRPRREHQAGKEK